MKKIILLLTIFLISLVTVAQEKKFSNGNVVDFYIKSAGVKVDGTFHKMSGKIIFDPQTPVGASFDISIDAASIKTGIEARDNHLKKEEYFDVKNFPTIKFHSTKIEVTNTGFLVTGDLNLKATTKQIKIPFTYTEKNKEGLFTGSFVLNRVDYGVGGSSWVMASDVTIKLAIKVSTP